MPNTLELRLIDAGLGARARTLAALALPAIRLSVTEADESDWPVGTSKLGGSPDMPAGVAWPQWKGAPLAFVGQVNLSDLRGIPVAKELPDAGVLAFFYHAEQETWGFDPKDAGSFRVYWFGPDTRLARVEPPDGLSDGGRYTAGSLSAQETVTLAPPQSDAMQALGLSDEEAEAYYTLYEELNAPGDGALHQLLGHPMPVQGEMQLECQLVSNGIYCGDASGYDDPRRPALEAGAPDWRLLLQVDSDDRVMWGDVGMLYYWIKGSDLAARDFGRAWMILQCS